MNSNKKWWSEEYNFFGDFYMEGDDSQEGYLIEKQQKLNERTEEEVSGVIKLLKLSEKMKILDCPCGYGRHSLELAKRGFEIIGSDINGTHLKKAMEGIEKSMKIKFIKESMIDLGYNNEFDGVINMFYSFGFFDTDEENEKVLENFYKALKPGGKFLMHTDVNIPRILNKKYKEEEVRTIKNGNKLKIIDNYNMETKRIDGAWIIQKQDGSEERKDYSVRVYTAEEFEYICKKIGFKTVEIYGDWNGGIYSEDAEDMMVVATK